MDNTLDITVKRIGPSGDGDGSCVEGGVPGGFPDCVAIEEPLEIRVGEKPFVVTMRTPGHDEELAAGLIFTEGVVSDPSGIERVTRPPSTKCASHERCATPENRVQVQLRDDAKVDLDPGRRGLLMSSSCGLCGKQTIDQVWRSVDPLEDGLMIDIQTIFDMPGRMLEGQHIFARTGGLHAAGLFDADGNLLWVREDVGRHNAVDKIVGCAILEQAMPLDSCLLMVSGRTSFEIIQKAMRARIPVVASVSAASSLAVSLAIAGNMTLLGFVRGENATVYAGCSRIRGV